MTGLEQLMAVPPQGLLLGEAIEPFRTLIPVGNASVEYPHKDGIVGLFEQNGLIMDEEFCLLAFRNIEHGPDEAQKFTALREPWRGRCNGPANLPVMTQETKLRL